MNSADLGLKLHEELMSADMKSKSFMDRAKCVCIIATQRLYRDIPVDEDDKNQKQYRSATDYRVRATYIGSTVWQRDLRLWKAYGEWWQKGQLTPEEVADEITMDRIRPVAINLSETKRALRTWRRATASEFSEYLETREKDLLKDKKIEHLSKKKRDRSQLSVWGKRKQVKALKRKIEKIKEAADDESLDNIQALQLLFEFAEANGVYDVIAEAALEQAA